MSELIIKELCKQRGMTLEQFADRMGQRGKYKAQSMSQMLNRKSMSLPWLEKAAHVLGVSVHELFANNTCTLTCPHCGKSFTIKTENI